MKRFATQSCDQGESLVELLVTLLVLGLAGVAITLGLTLSAKVSDTTRKESNASAILRDYAESLQASVAGGGYTSGNGLYAAFSVPAAYSGYTATNTSKLCWSQSLTSWGSCSTDIGVQQLTLQGQSPDGRAIEKLVIIVRRICTTSAELAACP